jgi:hypothetical protein
MRGVLAAFLLVHGIAHVVGFAVPWRLVTSADVPYRTTVAGGLIDLGSAGMRVVGVFWLVMAVSFVALAVSVLARTSWWYLALMPLIGISFVLCVLQWPDARFGVLANVAILALLAFGIAASGLTVP